MEPWKLTELQAKRINSLRPGVDRVCECIGSYLEQHVTDSNEQVDQLRMVLLEAIEHHESKKSDVKDVLKFVAQQQNEYMKRRGLMKQVDLVDDQLSKLENLMKELELYADRLEQEQRRLY